MTQRISIPLSTGLALLFSVTSGLSTAGCDKGDAQTEAPAAGPVAQAEPEQTEPAKVYPEPPPPTDPRPVNFPELQKAELPNKLQIYVAENHEVPLVDVQLVMRAGDMHEELVADMTASMLTEGTKKRSKEKIDSTIEQLGGSLSAGTNTLTAALSTRVLTKDIGTALDLMADVAQNPKFDGEALDKIKDQQKEALKAAKSDGGALGRTLLDMQLYPEGHPYGRDFPEETEIDSVDVEQLKKFHDAYWKPNNGYLMFSGDITLEEAEKLAKKHFGYWKPAESFPEHPLADFGQAEYQSALPKKMTVHIVDRRGASAEIFVANLSLARNSPDWEKMAVLNKVLGGGFGSRMFQHIREEKQLTYNIGSRVDPAKAMGSFVIATQSRKIEEMLNAIFDEIDAIRGDGPTAEEFAYARDSIANSFPLGIETASQVAGRARTVLTYGLPDDYWRTYRDRVIAVQHEDAKQAAQAYIHEVPVVVIVGKAKKVKKEIANVKALEGANVIVYDTDLKVQKGG